MIFVRKTIFGGIFLYQIDAASSSFSVTRILIQNGSGLPQLYIGEIFEIDNCCDIGFQTEEEAIGFATMEVL